MKELEKTRRISISAVLFVLILMISLLTFRKPEFIFVNSPEKTLQMLTNHETLIVMNEFNKLSPSGYQLIDVRTNIEFSKGHIHTAKNIPLSQLLPSIRQGKIQSDKKETPIIFYGHNPEQANAALMTLYQLGYEYIQVLSVKTYYENQEFHVKDVAVGASLFDYAQKMKEASTQKFKKVPAKAKTQTSKKKVVPKPKKKKKMPEGGC